MHNLEGISFEEVVDDKGLSYAAYRRQLGQDYSAVWIQLAGGLLTIIFLCLLAWQIQQRYPRLFWLSIPAFGLLTGFAISYVALFIHEAAHFHIHPDKKTNDILANIFLCSWLGTEVKAYRKIHWHHHLHLATPTDSENSYFNPVTAPFLFETLTGIHLLRIVTNRSNKDLLGKKLIRRSSRMLIGGALINLLLLVVAIYYEHWQFAVTWLISMLIFFPFFATLRQIIEHRDEMALNEKKFYSTTQTRISRLFTDSPFSQMVGAAGFNRHMIHHWDPTLPFTGLKKAEKFLLRSQRTRNIVESSRTSYLSVLKKLLLNHK